MALTFFRKYSFFDLKNPVVTSTVVDRILISLESPSHVMHHKLRSFHPLLNISLCLDAYNNQHLSLNTSTSTICPFGITGAQCQGRRLSALEFRLTFLHSLNSSMNEPQWKGTSSLIVADHMSWDFEKWHWVHIQDKAEPYWKWRSRKTADDQFDSYCWLHWHQSLRVTLDKQIHPLDPNEKARSPWLTLDNDAFLTPSQVDGYSSESEQLF